MQIVQFNFILNKHVHEFYTTRIRPIKAFEIPGKVYLQVTFCSPNYFKKYLMLFENRDKTICQIIWQVEKILSNIDVQIYLYNALKHIPLYICNLQ